MYADGSGFTLQAAMASVTATIEDNVATDVVERGFDLTLSNAIVRRNSAVRCGSGTTEGGGGFWVTGFGFTLESNKASDCNWTAFAVSGMDIVATRCTALRASGDGFRIRGERVSLTNSAATGCSGEGLDNRGTATVVTGCKFLGNRIDLANAVSDGATFADPAAVVSENKFKTGSTTREPEVDDGSK